MLGGMSQRPGWYDDPHDPTHLRYFDGVIWTENRAPKTSPTAARSTIGHAQQVPRGATGPVATAPQTGQQPPSFSKPPSYGQPPSGQQQPPGPPPTYGQQPPYGQPPSGNQPAYSYGQGYLGAGVKTTPDGVPLASWGQRFGAYLLDWLITSIISAILGGYWLLQFLQWYATDIQDIMQSSANGEPVVMPDTATIAGKMVSYLWPYLVVSFVVLVAYQVIFLTQKGATPGKMVLGIRVRLRDRPGHPSVAVVLKRLIIPVVAMIPLLSYITGIAALLDYLWPLWDENRQALHDKLAGTNVVLKDPGHR